MLFFLFIFIQSNSLKKKISLELAPKEEATECFPWPPLKHFFLFWISYFYYIACGKSILLFHYKMVNLKNIMYAIRQISNPGIETSVKQKGSCEYLKLSIIFAFLKSNINFTVSNLYFQERQKEMKREKAEYCTEMCSCHSDGTLCSCPWQYL